MASFNDFVEALKAGSGELAKEIFGDFGNEAKEDAQAFIEKTKLDLQKWTIMLAQGELSKDDFTDLVEAKKALAEIHALTQAGITLTKLERFRTEFIKLVINTAFDVFL